MWIVTHLFHSFLKQITLVICFFIFHFDLRIIPLPCSIYNFSQWYSTNPPYVIQISFLYEILLVGWYVSCWITYDILFPITPYNYIFLFIASRSKRRYFFSRSLYGLLYFFDPNLLLHYPNQSFLLHPPNPVLFAQFFLTSLLTYTILLSPLICSLWVPFQKNILKYTTFHETRHTCVSLFISADDRVHNVLRTLALHRPERSGDLEPTGARTASAP